MTIQENNIVTKMQSWAVREMMPWMSSIVPLARVEDELKSMVSNGVETFIFDIREGLVSIRDYGFEEKRGWSNITLERANLYKKWLQEVVSTYLMEIDISMVISVGDRSVESNIVPSFSFQKNQGEKSVLIPDVNLLSSEFSFQKDKNNFLNKNNHVIFVGSTSGGWSSIDDIENGIFIPRVEAAIHFADNKNVTFKLPVICQVTSEAAEHKLRAMGFGDRNWISWEETLNNKFIFSMDGNGATCDRVFNTLCSNSVLLKMSSDSVLYYFNDLIPWTHYIPINKYQDIDDIVLLEKNNPGLFHSISENSKYFSSQLLSKHSSLIYGRELLNIYKNVFYNCL